MASPNELKRMATTEEICNYYVIIYSERAIEINCFA
jgi:hypothetical protein